MKRVFFLPLVAMTLGVFAAPAFADTDDEIQAKKQLFEQNCAACHSLTVATNQNLNRADWNWVLDDMEDYGLTWLTDEQREQIVDYLVANHGYGE